MDRRAVLAGLGAGAAAGLLPAAAQNDIPRWSSPVIDLHFHMRNPTQSVAHQVGAGITAANLLTGTNAAQVAAVRAANL